MKRIIRDIFCIAVLIIVPNFICEKLGVYRSIEELINKKR